MKLAIIGRTEFLYDTTERLRDQGHQIGLVVTAREAPEYRRTVDDFRRLAEACRAPFVESSRLDSPELLARIQDLDLGISVNFPSVIGEAAIARFRLGILNAHAGDLPRYRGNACLAWAILNGETRAALCVHRMVGGELDTGDIIARVYRPIGIADRVGELMEFIGIETPSLFVEAVQHLERNQDYVLERQPVGGGGLRCYPRVPEDGRIDWGNTNEQVLRLVNASSEPYAGAFCSLAGERLTIWRAQLYQDQEHYLAVPGQVAAIEHDNGSIVVICGAGKLRVTDVGWRGSRVAPATIIGSIRTRLT